MGGSSRLEKLLRLLECGTSDATRKAAAKQIVEITKSHPQQLPSVIRKVHQYLYSKGWDTRIAASETLGYLAEAFPHTSILDLAARCAQLHGQQASAAAAASPTMTFSTFSLQVLLDKGFESGGEDLGNQMDTDNLINDDDLDTEIKRTPSGLSGKGGAGASAAAPKQQPAELLQSMEGLSARERNQAKRRAKAMARGEGSGRGAHGAASALREVLQSQASCAAVEAPVNVRHGAATALREVLRSQASCAAVEAPVADEVTAPVRETAAQTLGVTLAPLNLPSTNNILHLLTQLQGQTEWDVRYGGYLGLKYMLAARLDLAAQLLPAALPFLQRGLEDPDDDVRAASADALVPVASELLALGPGPAQTIRSLLWGLLAELDELSPAIASVVQLLSHLYSQPPPKTTSSATSAAADGVGAGVAVALSGAASKELTHQLPRLWPYLRHGLSGVRLSTTTCMERLLAASKRQACTEWLQPLLPMMLRLIFQQVLVENDSRVQALCPHADAVHQVHCPHAHAAQQVQCPHAYAVRQMYWAQVLMPDLAKQWVQRLRLLQRGETGCPG
ncbi:armadillo-type protein [Dunaliella salina]|uniref:Armadillo-type protein n=1 Tax=Dunaliella salina TaxID=3046 RepID=A0ABQ7G3Q1_DUNSA|nr:armadillo-type protein [Dunaliella salina]|eukprot:KAF5829237.1 armadillo-type protein [Dunaliella salina]